MTVEIVLQTVIAASSSIVLLHSGSVINRMTCKTHHGIRAAYVLVAAGAFGALMAVFDGHVPGIAELMFMAGYGCLYLFDRRTDVECPYLIDLADRESRGR